MTRLKQSLSDRFEQFHADNPRVYDLFKNFTDEVINAGYTKFSAWSIIGRIRWETDVVVLTDEPFRISNDFIALYSRLWMKEHPEYDKL